MYGLNTELLSVVNNIILLKAYPVKDIPFPQLLIFNMTLRSASYAWNVDIARRELTAGCVVRLRTSHFPIQPQMMYL